MSSDKRKLKNSSLTKYFLKKPKSDCDNIVSYLKDSVEKAVPGTSLKESAILSANVDENTGINLNDIGNFIGEQLIVEKKIFLLKNFWKPDAKFNFPVSGKRNLKFQHTWFGKWNWLVYSKRFDGTFCKICVLFSDNYGGIGHQPLGKIAKTAFSNWKDAIEMFNCPSSCT